MSALVPNPGGGVLPDLLAQTFLLDATMADAIMRITVLGRLLAHLRVARRCICKDVPVFGHPLNGVVVSTDSDQYAQVRAHDLRTEAIAAMGQTKSPGELDQDPHLAPGFWLDVSPIASSGYLELPRYRVGSVHWDVPRIAAGEAWWADGLPLTLFVGQAVSLTLAHADLPTVRMLGYSHLAASILLRAIQTALDGPLGERYEEAFPAFRATTTPEGILATLLKPPDPRHLRSGPVVRRMNAGEVCVDYVAVSSLCQRSTNGGIYGSAPRKSVADDFEMRVQTEVDQSGWAPPPSLRSVRGRTLKGPAGDLITDIDALAARGDTLLLIDCKTHYLEGLSEGEHAPTRNVRDRVASEAKSWVAKVERIRAQPLGKNFDFTAFAQVIPLLVLPYLPWLDEETFEWQAVDGLQLVTTLQELILWLGEP